MHRPTTFAGCKVSRVIIGWRRRHVISFVEVDGFATSTVAMRVALRTFVHKQDARVKRATGESRQPAPHPAQLRGTDSCARISAGFSDARCCGPVDIEGATEGGRRWSSSSSITVPSRRNWRTTSSASRPSRALIHHVPDANPANPPGRSTHERRNDGVAYPGHPGDDLEYWQVGMDWDNPPAAIAAARKLGWIATVTYRNNVHEAQHVNFRKEPDPGVPHARPGSDGPEVRQITHILATIRSPVDGRPYLPEAFPHYGPHVIDAVKRFQAEHHQDVDGIVGPHTATQLAVALRRHEQHPAVA